MLCNNGPGKYPDVLFDFETIHLPVVILLDTTAHMSCDMSQKTADGVRVLIEELNCDLRVARSIDVCVIGVNEQAEVLHPFTTADRFELPEIHARGCSAMNKAIVFGLDELHRRRRFYMERGVPYYKPWMILLSGSNPTDEYDMLDSARGALESYMERKRLVFFQFTTADDSRHLTVYPCTRPLRINDNDIVGAFRWVGKSLASSAIVSPRRVSVDLPGLPPCLSVIN